MVLECGPTKDVWDQMDLTWVIEIDPVTFWDWVSYLIMNNGPDSSSMILLTVWMLWYACNKNVI